MGDPAGDRAGGDPAAAILADEGFAAALADPEAAPPAVLDRVHRVDHLVPIDWPIDGAPGDPTGGHVFVTETFTARSWLRSPRRAVLNLSGPVTTGSAWNIDVAGYDGGAREARRGFFAFTADYVGFGRSSCPVDGSTIAPMDQVEPMRRVLEHVRDRRGVTGVDLVCESIGGGIATQLAADPALVRSAVITTIMYTGMSELARSLLLSPEYRAFLESFDDGYMVTDAGYYSQFSADSPPEVAAWLAATQPGRYPTGFFLRMYGGYPYYDPGVARCRVWCSSARVTSSHRRATASRSCATTARTARR